MSGLHFYIYIKNFVKYQGRQSLRIYEQRNERNRELGRPTVKLEEEEFLP